MTLHNFPVKNQAFLIFQIPFHVVPYQIQNMDIDISMFVLLALIAFEQ